MVAEQRNENKQLELTVLKILKQRGTLLEQLVLTDGGEPIIGQMVSSTYGAMFQDLISWFYKDDPFSDTHPMTDETFSTLLETIVDISNGVVRTVAEPILGKDYPLSETIHGYTNPIFMPGVLAEAMTLMTSVGSYETDAEVIDYFEGLVNTDLEGLPEIIGETIPELLGIRSFYLSLLATATARVNSRFPNKIEYVEMLINAGQQLFGDDFDETMNFHPSQGAIGAFAGRLPSTTLSHQDTDTTSATEKETKPPPAFKDLLVGGLMGLRYLVDTEFRDFALDKNPYLESAFRAALDDTFGSILTFPMRSRPAFSQLESATTTIQNRVSSFVEILTNRYEHSVSDSKLVSYPSPDSPEFRAAFDNIANSKLATDGQRKEVQSLVRVCRTMAMSGYVFEQLAKHHQPTAPTWKPANLLAIVESGIAFNYELTSAVGTDTLLTSKMMVIVEFQLELKQAFRNYSLGVLSTMPDESSREALTEELNEFGKYLWPLSSHLKPDWIPLGPGGEPPLPSHKPQI